MTLDPRPSRTGTRSRTAWLPAPVLVAVGLAASAGAFAQSTVTFTSDPLLLSGTNHAISVTTSEVTVSRVQTTTFSLGAFDADLGVLTGVSGSFVVLPGTTLSGRADHGATFDSSVTASWALGGIAQGSRTLNTVGWTNPDALAVADSASWAQLAGPSLPSLSSFIGNTPLNASVTTTLALTRTDGKGNGKLANAYIVETSSPTSLTDLRARASLTYTYLAHANASFSSGLDEDSMGLAIGNDGYSAFSLHALGSAGGTAGLRFDASTSVSCAPTSDCSAYELVVDNPDALLAGGSSFAGRVLRRGTGAAGPATFTITLFEDPSVGAPSTQRSTVLTLSVENAASVVPEPQSGLLLAAGLMAIGGLRRQRLRASRPR